MYIVSAIGTTVYNDVDTDPGVRQIDELHDGLFTV